MISLCFLELTMSGCFFSLNCPFSDSFRGWSPALRGFCEAGVNATRLRRSALTLAASSRSLPSGCAPSIFSIGLSCRWPCMATPVD